MAGSRGLVKLFGKTIPVPVEVDIQEDPFKETGGGGGAGGERGEAEDEDDAGKVRIFLSERVTDGAFPGLFLFRFLPPIAASPSIPRSISSILMSFSARVLDFLNISPNGGPPFLSSVLCRPAIFYGSPGEGI